MLIRRIGLILLLIFAAIPSHASTTKKSGTPQHSSTTTPSQRLGSVEAWTAYSYDEKSGKVCYVAGEPKKSDPAKVRRKPTLAMVKGVPRKGQPTTDTYSLAGFAQMLALIDAACDIKR